MNVQELKQTWEELAAQATSNLDVEDSASNLLDRIGQLIIDNAANTAIITEIGLAMTEKKGQLNSSNTRLAAAVVAGTPSA